MIHSVEQVGIYPETYIHDDMRANSVQFVLTTSAKNCSTSSGVEDGVGEQPREPRFDWGAVARSFCFMEITGFVES